MNFKTHPANLQQIKDVLEVYDDCYFHGDGNIYTRNEDHPEDPWYDSNFRVGFTNPLPGESPEPHPSTFRVLFRAGDKIPDTVEEIYDMFLKAKMRQVAQKETTVKTGNNVKVIPAKKKVAQPPAEEMKAEESGKPEETVLLDEMKPEETQDLFTGAEKPVSNGKNGKAK